MDMTLEERIAASNRGRNNGRRDGPRGGGGGGVRKNRNPRPQRNRSFKDTDSGIDQDGAWTHDRWEPNNDTDDDHMVHGDDTYNNRDYNDSEKSSRSWNDRRDNRAPRSAKQNRGFKVLISNLHSEVGETELKAVFAEPGGLRVARILWERDRSTGRAFAIYETHDQADYAVKNFNTQLAKGQPIYVRHDDDSAAPKRPLESRISYPNRSASPPPQRSSVAKPAPAHIDRYVPDQNRYNRDSRERSQNRPRRDTDRGGPRGERRERGGRGGRGGGRGGRNERPKKTKEELDAEMEDYFNAPPTLEAASNDAPAPQTAEKDDVDMDI